MTDAWPLGGEPVCHDGRPIGQTTSAASGHRIQKQIALASLDATIPASMVNVDIGGNRFQAHVHDGAAFDPSGARMRAF